MTSLLGRLLPLFSGQRKVEDLFTEALARLFERRPDLCLAWLQEAGLLPAGRPSTAEGARVRVSSQGTFAPLDHHDAASRVDLLIEVHRPAPEASEDGETGVDAMIVESKIGSWEGQDQLRRYAEHLRAMTGFDTKTLAYVTRVHDPKDRDKVLAGPGGTVKFEQLRWHDFYRFLQGVAEKDALVEEVMLFMEEQGMAASHRFSSDDLVALSGVPRAFEIFDETLGGEVRTEMERFAGNKIRREAVGMDHVRRFGYYLIVAPLHDWDLFAHAGYQLSTTDGYPEATMVLKTKPGAVERDACIAAMKRIASRDGWEGDGLDAPKAWSHVYRTESLAGLLSQDDHVAAVKRFFVESVGQLREELTAFKEEHPELPWEGPHA